MQAIHSRSKREKAPMPTAPPAIPPAPAPAMSPSLAVEAVEAGRPVSSPPTAAPPVPRTKTLRMALASAESLPL